MRRGNGQCGLCKRLARLTISAWTGRLTEKLWIRVGGFRKIFKDPLLGGLLRDCLKEVYINARLRQSQWNMAMVESLSGVLLGLQCKYSLESGIVQIFPGLVPLRRISEGVTESRCGDGHGWNVICSRSWRKV